MWSQGDPEGEEGEEKKESIATELEVVARQVLIISVGVLSSGSS